MQVVVKEQFYDPVTHPVIDPKRGGKISKEIKMYSNNVENKLGVTIKTCNRISANDEDKKLLHIFT
jgi:hypothetical protein